eukprot:12492-Heterococcus_DN1.PRE.2
MAQQKRPATACSCSTAACSSRSSTASVKSRLQTALASKLTAKYGATDAVDMVARFLQSRSTVSLQSIKELDSSFKTSSSIRQRPNTSCSRCRGQANSTNEWLVLDTYKTLETEAAKAAAAAKAQQTTLQMRAALQQQMTEKRARDVLAAREDTAAGAALLAQAAQYRAAEAQKAAVAHAALQQQRTVREAQIEANRQRRIQEAAERSRDDAAALAAAAAFEQAERSKAAAKVAARTAQMQAMTAANAAHREAKAAAARRDAAENVRLMQESNALAEAEEARRRAAAAARSERYAAIGRLWEHEGAGKAQREAELALERIVAVEAAAKEAADAARELRDKQALLDNRLRCQLDNVRLMQHVQLINPQHGKVLVYVLMATAFTALCHDELVNASYSVSCHSSQYNNENVFSAADSLKYE